MYSQSGIYIMKRQSFLNEEMFEKLLMALPLDEISKINRFRNQDDKENSLFAYHFLQFILNNYFNFNENYCFKRDNYNRPYLESNQWYGDFNISHSNSYIVIAVTINGKVGVDIERKASLFDESIIDNILSKNEVKVFYSMSSEQKVDYFYKLWTLKESYTKLVGYGLLMDLPNIEFSFKDSETIFINNGIENLDYKFQIYEIDEEYQISLCSNNLKFNKTIHTVDYSYFISTFE